MVTSDANQLDICSDCGGAFPPVDGDTHAYLGASAGCWAAFNEVLAREFQDAEYFAVHRLTVDAYTTQHPGDQTDRRAMQSVNIHLAALCALIEQDCDFAFVPRLLKTLANKHGASFSPLPAPALESYKLTVKDVLKAENAQQHGEIVRDWAANVWRAWAPHHQIARDHVARING